MSTGVFLAQPIQLDLSHSTHKMGIERYYLVLPLALLIRSSQCFSIAVNGNEIGRVKSIIVDHAAAPNPPSETYDTTTIPVEKILPALLASDEPECGRGGGADLTTTVSYSSEFFPGGREVSAIAYADIARSRHADCLDLFDRYETNLVRCETLLNEKSLNIRWNASWVPPGSAWLYDLADAAGWEVTRRCPHPATVATFSWRAVFNTFRNAFATGCITLPISSVEGNTVVSIAKLTDGGIDRCISLRESIDLITEADANRLRNRRVAQELASWIDVSRRPPEEFGVGADEWAGEVRRRVISGVEGAGPLDVDPNEDDGEGGAALLLFGVISLGALTVLFDFIFA